MIFPFFFRRVITYVRFNYRYTLSTCEKERKRATQSFHHWQGHAKGTYSSRQDRILLFDHTRINLRVARSTIPFHYLSPFCLFYSTTFYISLYPFTFISNLKIPFRYMMLTLFLIRNRLTIYHGAADSRKIIWPTILERTPSFTVPLTSVESSYFCDDLSRIGGELQCEFWYLPLRKSKAPGESSTQHDLFLSREWSLF